MIIFLISCLPAIWVNNGMAQAEWDKYPENPVLDLGQSGAWDDHSISNPSVLFDGTEYKMWFTGFNGSMRIGYATSKDGVHWTKYSQNPVLDLGPEGSWDAQHVANPSVLFDGTEYKMWYTGLNMRMRIGYATSKDGIHWTKHPENPVLDVGAWETCPDSDIWSPSVLFLAGEYKMWFTGFDGRMKIGYATSKDGVHWVKYTAHPVLEPGTWGAWDDRGVWSPCVLFLAGEYKMWYSGWDGETVRIGYATSRDGIHWTKHPANPALDPGTTIMSVTPALSSTVADAGCGILAVHTVRSIRSGSLPKLPDPI